MGLNTTQMSALSRLFSSRVFKEMAKKGRSPLFSRLFGETGLLNRYPSEEESVRTAFESAFSLLKKDGIRNEYVYRSALTHNILLGRHSLNTASMLTEFRVGECKADLVILNGTATVYEIKSDRDSLCRLKNQINNYQKVFPRVYVISSDAHLEEVLDIAPESVGVMRLAKWNRISTVRKAADRLDILCPVTVFESLRISEAKKVLGNLDIDVPDVPNTVLWEELRGVFSGLSSEDVHEQMVVTLKKTRDLSSLKLLVSQLPPSLQPAALTFNLRKMDHSRLVGAVNTPLVKAMEWG